MRLLVTGAGGMLATDLIPCFAERGNDVLGLPHAALDVTDLALVRSAVDEYAPEVVVNCAAYTRVDDAEKEEHRALMVNGLGVQNLSLVCYERCVPLVHFSTDYVFDGTKCGPLTIYDSPNPINAYGRSKCLGEQYVLWLLTKFYLIRTSWLFGTHGHNFIETMLRLGRERDTVTVVDDQWGCPTWTHDLSEAVADLIETGRYGLYHITNSGATNWFEFAKSVFELSDMDTKVLPASSEEVPRAATRPKNCVLDPFPLNEVLGREMPPWREALSQYLHRRGSVSKE